MVEENYLDKKTKNIECEFVDDISIFEKDLEKIEKEFNAQINSNDIIKVGNLELHFSEEKVDSLYYFPNGNILD